MLCRIVPAVIFLALADMHQMLLLMNGDMGWLAPEHRQWMCVTRKWCRLGNFDDSLLAKFFLVTSRSM